MNPRPSSGTIAMIFAVGPRHSQVDEGRDGSRGDEILSGIVLAGLPDILGRLAAWIHLLASASRRPAGIDIDLAIAQRQFVAPTAATSQGRMPSL